MFPKNKHPLSAFTRPLCAFSLFLLLCTYFYFQKYILFYMQWADESETIVVSKMIASGQKLYSEIFNNHGPLTFLGGTVLESFGHFSVVEHRVIIVFLQLIIFFVILKSKYITEFYAKTIVIVVTGSFFIYYLPFMLGHTNQYDILAGCFLAIASVVYIVPSIYVPEKLSSADVAIGSLLLCSVAFLAITYWPSLLLVIISSYRKNFFWKFIFWFFLAVLFNVIYIFIVGSIPGYIADHFYFNICILPLYAPMTLNGIAKNLYTSMSFTHIIIYLLIVVSITHFFIINKKWHRFILLMIAIICFFIRGYGLHAMPGIYLLILLFALSFGAVSERVGKQKIILPILMIGFVLFTIFYGKLYVQMLLDKQLPKTTEFAELVKKTTLPEDRIIVYTFNCFQYLAADRLPASGNFFYLPWQAKYNENPLFGIKIDSCDDILKNRPKIMYISKWLVWGMYPWESYAERLQKIIDEHYFQVPEKPFYIRKDIAISSGIHFNH